VLQRAVVPVSELERGDPLVGQPGWERISDLAHATDQGLIPPRIEPEGGSWVDLYAELERRAQPMLDAGWAVVDTDQDESWEYGNSVAFDLERDGVTMELEYFEHGQLIAYPLDAGRATRRWPRVLDRELDPCVGPRGVQAMWMGVMTLTVPNRQTTPRGRPPRDRDPSTPAALYLPRSGDHGAAAVRTAIGSLAG
jgi:hypothetical protein